MAKNQSALPVMVDALKSVDDGELMRRLLAMMLQKQIDAEATSVIEAGLHERSAARTTQRNGAGAGLVTTGVGDVTLRSPRPAPGRSSQRYWPHGGGSTSRSAGQGSASPRSPGSAASSTRRSQRGGPGPWTRLHARTCSRSAPTARSARAAGSCPKPCSLRPACVPTGIARSSAARSGTTRPRHSGPSS